MYKKFILLISILLLILTGCSNENIISNPPSLKPKAKQLVLKVAKLYNESNPEISYLNETETVGPEHIKMYRVELKGDFHNNNLMATHISLSVYADGTRVWAIEAFDDNDKPTIWKETIDGSNF
ncbi:MAG: hypothetical protein H7Y18_10480 [Clostridiaceae bacterium]|nr:hypothetical protein [Clostridiaceae bacterium]